MRQVIALTLLFACRGSEGEAAKHFCQNAGTFGEAAISFLSDATYGIERGDCSAIDRAGSKLVGLRLGFHGGAAPFRERAEVKKVLGLVLELSVDSLQEIRCDGELTPARAEKLRTAIADIRSKLGAIVAACPAT